MTNTTSNTTPNSGQSKKDRTLAKLNPAQRDWVVSKAYHDTVRDLVRRKDKARTTTEDDLQLLHQAIEELRTSTKNLLDFAYNFHKKLRPSEPEDTLQTLYRRDLWMYMLTDILPSKPESKLIKLLIQTNFTN